MKDISYQLYSSRNFPPLSDTLKMVADLGYTQVEGYGALYAEPEMVTELETQLGELGLSMPTGHFSLDMVRDDPVRTLSIARHFDMKAVIVPHVGGEDRPSDKAGWEAFGKMLHEVGKPIRDAGHGFGWHNHEFEFEDLGSGETPMDFILAGSDENITELDLAWIMVGGHDALDWIYKAGNRVLAAHIKDIAPKGDLVDEDGWADVGHGTVDWAPIVAALRNVGTEVFVMEHDNPTNDERFARRSIETARAF